MKKDRNTFFAESSFMNQSNFPGPNPNMNIANAPFMQSAYANQGFYAGPMNNNMPNNYNTQMPSNTNYNDYSDLESRLSKIERNINRLDARISKLENTNFYPTEEIDTTNNIYMV